MQLTTLLLAALGATMAAAAAIDPQAAAQIDEVMTVDKRDGTIEKRGCYSGGESWGTWKGTAIQHARDICNGGGTNTYPPDRRRDWCRNLGDGKRVNFSIWNFSPGYQTLTVSNCVDKLLREINGCNTGGVTNYDKFQFRSDPNNGYCP